MVDTLANTLSEVEVVGEERGDAHALVNKLAYTLAEEEAVGYTWNDAHALVELWLTR